MGFESLRQEHGPEIGFRDAAATLQSDMEKLSGLLASVSGNVPPEGKVALNKLKDKLNAPAF